MKIFSILKRSCKRKHRKCHQKWNNSKKVRFSTTLRGGDVEIVPPVYDPSNNSDLSALNETIARTGVQVTAQANNVNNDNDNNDNDNNDNNDN